jgi:hypothetical protein
MTSENNGCGGGNDSAKQAFDELKAGFKDLGLEDEECERMARLFILSPTEEEKKRWIEVRVMTNDGKQIIVDDDMSPENAGIQVCLFNMAYNGLLTRVQRGGWIDANQ